MEPIEQIMDSDTEAGTTFDVTLVHGLAGTGKTYSMAQRTLSVIEACEQRNQGIGVILCGPTGSATHALFQSSDMEEVKPYIIFWGTLSKLQSYVHNDFVRDPRAKRSTQKFRTLIATFPNILIVVDEFFAATKLTLQHLFTMTEVIVRARKNLYLVMSGDRSQLSCPDNTLMAGQIEYIEKARGLWLSFLIAMGGRRFEYIEMNEFKRFEYTSREFQALFERLVREMASQILGEGQVNMDVTNALAAHWIQNKLPDPLDPEFDKVTYLCATNAAVNDRIRDRRKLLIDHARITKSQLIRVPKKIRLAQKMSVVHIPDGDETEEFYIGEPVVILRNVCVESGIVNGTTGIFRGAFCGKLGDVVGIGVEVCGTVERIPYFPEYGSSEQTLENRSPPRYLAVASLFAMTVHKSQGQTYRTGVIVIDRSVLRNSSPELLMVAITRSTRPEKLIFDSMDVDRLAMSLCTVVETVSHLTDNRKRLGEMWRAPYWDAAVKKIVK